MISYSEISDQCAQKGKITNETQFHIHNASNRRNFCCCLDWQNHAASSFPGEAIDTDLVHKCCTLQHISRLCDSRDSVEHRI